MSMHWKTFYGSVFYVEQKIHSKMCIEFRCNCPCETRDNDCLRGLGIPGRPRSCLSRSKVRLRWCLRRNSFVKVLRRKSLSNVQNLWSWQKFRCVVLGVWLFFYNWFSCSSICFRLGYDPSWQRISFQLSEEIIGRRMRFITTVTLTTDTYMYSRVMRVVDIYLWCHSTLSFGHIHQFSNKIWWS